MILTLITQFLVMSSTPSTLCPHSFFLSLPFLWPPLPKPDFLTSPSHFLFLERSFLIPPPCRNWCFCFFLRCFMIWSFVFSSERALWSPELCTFGPRRPRPRPGRGTTQQRGWRLKLARLEEGLEVFTFRVELKHGGWWSIFNRQTCLCYSFWCLPTSCWLPASSACFSIWSRSCIINLVFFPSLLITDMLSSDTTSSQYSLILS